MKTTAVLLAKNPKTGAMDKVGTVVLGARGFEFVLLDPTYDFASIPRPAGKTEVQLTMVYTDRDRAKGIAEKGQQ